MQEKQHSQQQGNQAQFQIGRRAIGVVDDDYRRPAPTVVTRGGPPPGYVQPRIGKDVPIEIMMPKSKPALAQPQSMGTVKSTSTAPKGSTTKTTTTPSFGKPSMNTSNRRGY